jgi:hypothetical protein
MKNLPLVNYSGKIIFPPENLPSFRPFISFIDRRDKKNSGRGAVYYFSATNLRNSIFKNELIRFSERMQGAI